MKAWRALFPVLALGLAGCADSGAPSGDDVVARAAGVEFKAETAAEILAPQPQLPADTAVVRILADLWVQYFLLAKTSSEDSTLANLDVTSLVERQIQGEMVSGLRDRVIQVDTAVSDVELRARFEAELPGGRLRARHILLQFPVGASPAQADSVRALAEELRSRIQSGEDFEAIARDYSQDTQTASNGGDLGSFGRNEMFPQFEEAAFALDEGELSDVVETTLGLHLIRVDERVIPDFEERRDQFRAQLRNRIVMEAESVYVANLVEAAQIEADSAGFESVRLLAAAPDLALTPRALDRSLVRYEGGVLTLEEFREWLLTNPADMAVQVSGASDEQLNGLLHNLTRSELLVNDAKAKGVEVPQDRIDALTSEILDGVKTVAQGLGFFEITREEGESSDEAADRVVRGILAEVVQGEREVIHLQTIAFTLKEQYGARIFGPGLGHAVTRINELRLQPTETVDPTLPEAAGDTVTADTSGGQG